MDKSLITILMLTPGVIGIALAGLLRGNSKPDNLSTNITSYFLYSAISWLIAELIGPGYVLSAIMQGQNITVMQLFSPIGIVIVITFIWVLWLNKVLVKCINSIYRLINRNEIFMETVLFEKVFNDHEAHFIEVKKDDVIQARGYLEHYQCNEKSFSLKDISDYEHYEYKEKTVRYLVYPNSNVIIREFEYPELLENNTGDK